MPLTCRKCKENIKPAMIAVKVAGKEYHPACVSCHRCDRGLWGKDYVRSADGTMICDGKQLATCVPHNRPASSSSTRPASRNTNNNYILPNADDEARYNAVGINKQGKTGSSRYAPVVSNATAFPAASPRRPEIDPSPRKQTATLDKFCNKCKQSVMRKKFITFEDGEVVCQNCNVMTAFTPRPKSAHMVLCSICNKTVKGTRYFTEPDDSIVCTICDQRGARCYKCKNLFKFKDTPCIVQNPALPGTGIQLHKSCFNCESCSEPLETNNYFQGANNLPVCPECHHFSQSSNQNQNTQVNNTQSPASPFNNSTNNNSASNSNGSNAEQEEELNLCIKCSTPIIGPCLIVEGQPIHHDCFACADCKAYLNTDTGFYKNAQGDAICQDCDLLRSSVPKCGKCFGPIAQMNGIQYMHKSFHPECYSCVQCGVNLSTMKRTMTDKEFQNLYCEGCHIKFLAPKCSKCNDPIYNPHRPGTIHEDRHFHLSCFACSKCKKTLADKKFFKSGNQLRCETCF